MVNFESKDLVILLLTVLVLFLLLNQNRSKALLSVRRVLDIIGVLIYILVIGYRSAIPRDSSFKEVGFTCLYYAVLLFWGYRVYRFFKHRNGESSE